MEYWSDYIVGTGAVQNLEIGFIPDSVRVTDLSGTRVLTHGLTHVVVPFDAGGAASTAELKEGDLIASVAAATGVPSGASGIIKKVLVTGGSWAGGDAAGYIVLEHEELEGNWDGKDNQGIRVAAQKGNYGAPVSASIPRGADLNNALIRGATVLNNDSQGTAASGANDHILAYDGTSAGRGKGVTLQSAVVGDNDPAFVEAWRSGPS